jgi:hypothetical protein
VPENKELYCAIVVITYYGKGIAYAAIGDIDNFVYQRNLFRSAANLVPESSINFPNKVVDKLKVASAMLDGELKYRRGNFKAASSYLQIAI